MTQQQFNDYVNAENLWEIERDTKFVEDDLDIEWIFEGTTSDDLLNLLENANIPYKFIDK